MLLTFESLLRKFALRSVCTTQRHPLAYTYSTCSVFSIFHRKFNRECIQLCRLALFAVCAIVCEAHFSVNLLNCRKQSAKQICIEKRTDEWQWHRNSTTKTHSKFPFVKDFFRSNRKQAATTTAATAAWAKELIEH